MLTFRKKEIQKRTSILLFVFAVGIFFPMHSVAQEVTTPSGSRSMVQNGIIAEGRGGIGAVFDLRYTVSWEAKKCEQPRPYGARPQAVAWVSNYTVEGVEYRDEHFSADEFGQGTLKRGLEIIRLNSGIEAEVKSLESGESAKLETDWIPAEPQKRDVCDMDATEIFHYDLSRDEHEVRITNTNRTRLNKVRITRNLWEAIALKAIDSKMNKARVAADRGDKDRAQQLAMNARNLCPDEGDPVRYDTECEIEITEFLRGLSNQSGNQTSSTTRDSNNINATSQSTGVSSSDVNSSQQSNSSDQSRTNSETDADEGTTKKDDREKSQEKKARKKKAQEKYEDLKRAEQERERQKAIDEQTARNQQAAIELSAAAILVHTMIAKFIYANMNQTATQSHFPGPSGRSGIQVGYGLSYIPFHRWEGNGDDYNGGNNSEVLTLDLNAQFNYDLLYTEHFGLGGYAGGAFGHLLQEYRLKWNAGLQSFWGAPGFKLLGRYEIGADNLTHKSWIDADLDNQTYGKERWRHQRFSLGPRISWGNQRHHLDLLYNFDYIYNRSEYFSGEIWAHNEPQKHARGLSLRYWQQGKFNLSLDYLQMPLPGETTPKLQFSFLRSIDGYQGTVGRFDFEDLRDRVKPQDRWTLSFLNPELTWQNQNSELKAAEKPVISAPLRLLHVNREFMLSPSLSIAPGLGFTSNRGITRIQGTDRLRLIKPLNLDVPLALRWYAIQRSLKHFWLGANYEYSFNLAGIHRVVNEEEYNLDEDTRVENSPLRDQSARYHLGLGMDVALNPQSALRFALFYQWAPQLGAPGYSISTSAFRLQAALIL